MSDAEHKTPGMEALVWTVVVIVGVAIIVGMVLSEKALPYKQAEAYIKDQPGTTRVRNMKVERDGVYRAEVDYITPMGGPSRKIVVVEVGRNGVKELKEEAAIEALGAVLNVTEGR